MKSYSAAYKYGVMLHLYKSGDFSNVAYCGQRGQKIAFLHRVALGFWSLHRQIDCIAVGPHIQRMEVSCWKAKFQQLINQCNDCKVFFFYLLLLSQPADLNKIGAWKGNLRRNVCKC